MAELPRLFDDEPTENQPFSTGGGLSALTQRTPSIMDRVKQMQAEAPPVEPERTFGGTLKDVALSAAKIPIGVGEAAVGLGSLATGGKFGKFMEEQVGYRPDEARQFIDQYYSPAQQAANQRVEDAEGFVGKLVEGVKNPSVPLHSAIESLGYMGAGGAIARGIPLAAGKLAGSSALAGKLAQAGATRGGVAGLSAAGEGFTMAGSQAENIRRQTADKELTLMQQLAAVGTGVIGAGIARGGQKVSDYFKVLDPDLWLAGGSKLALQQGVDTTQAIGRKATALSLAKSLGDRADKAVKGYIAEGVFEEMPQEMFETFMENLALGKPWSEGVGGSGALGLLSGGIMGGVAGASGPSLAKRKKIDEQRAKREAELAELDAAINQARSAEAGQKVTPSGQPIPKETETSGPMGRAVNSSARPANEQATGLLSLLPKDETITFKDGSFAKRSEIIDSLIQDGSTQEEAIQIVDNLIGALRPKPEPSGYDLADYHASQAARQLPFGLPINQPRDNNEETLQAQNTEKTESSASQNAEKVNWPQAVELDDINYQLDGFKETGEPIYVDSATSAIMPNEDIERIANTATGQTELDRQSTAATDTSRQPISGTGEPNQSGIGETKQLTSGRGAQDAATTPQNPILKQTKKGWVSQQLKSQQIKKTSPGYDAAVQRIEGQYEVELDRALAFLPFEAFNNHPLNKGSTESANRQAWESLRSDYGIDNNETTQANKAKGLEDNQSIQPGQLVSLRPVRAGRDAGDMATQDAQTVTNDAIADLPSEGTVTDSSNKAGPASQAKSKFAERLATRGVAIDDNGDTYKVVAGPNNDGYLLEVTDSEGNRTTRGNPRSPWGLTEAHQKAAERGFFSDEQAKAQKDQPVQQNARADQAGDGQVVESGVGRSEVSGKEKVTSETARKLDLKLSTGEQARVIESANGGEFTVIVAGELYGSFKMDSAGRVSGVKAKLKVLNSHVKEAANTFADNQQKTTKPQNQKNDQSQNTTQKTEQQEAAQTEALDKEAAKKADDKYKAQKESEWINRIRKNASETMLNIEGKSLRPAANDYVEEIIAKRRRLTDDELSTIAKKHSFSEDIIKGFTTHAGFSFDSIMFAAERGDVGAKAFIARDSQEVSDNLQAGLSAILDSNDKAVIAVIDTIKKDAPANWLGDQPRESHLKRAIRNVLQSYYYDQAARKKALLVFDYLVRREKGDKESDDRLQYLRDAGFKDIGTVDDLKLAIANLKIERNSTRILDGNDKRLQILEKALIDIEQEQKTQDDNSGKEKPPFQKQVSKDSGSQNTNKPDSGSQKAKSETQKPKPRKVSITDSDDILAAIAKLGGINTQEGKSNAFDQKHLQTRGYAIKRVFTKNGRSFDAMAEALSEYGYPVNYEQGTGHTLVDVLHDALNRKAAGNTGIYTQVGNEILAETMQLQNLDNEEQAKVFIDIEDVIIDGDISKNDIDNALDNLDDIVTSESFTGQEAINALDDFFGITDEQETIKGSAGEVEAEALSSYTESEISQREAEAKRREQEQLKAEQQAERKEKADQDVDNIVDEMLGTAPGTLDVFGQDSAADKIKADKSAAKPESSKNTIFTEDAAAAARARLKAKLGQLGSGIDPEMMMDGITLAGYHIEKGARTFAAYSKAMLDDLGEGVKPYLRSFYEGVRHYPGFDNKGMTSASQLDAADKHGVYHGELWSFDGKPAREVVSVDDNHIIFSTKDDAGKSSVSTGNFAQQKSRWKKVGAGVITDNAQQNQGGTNEHENASTDSERTLAGELPGNLSSDEEEGKTGKRVTGGSRTNQHGDGVAQGDRNERTGSLGSVEGAIHTDGTVEGVSGRGELERDLSKEDYVIQNEKLGEGSYGQKLAANMAAIRLVKQLERENRSPTQEEKNVLAGFVGWGALKNVFNPNSKSKQDREAYRELKDILTEDEMFWAGQGVLAQHFTSPEVVSSMYRVLEHFGFKGGNTLEPTLGVGNFIGAMPTSMKASSTWYGSEIDPIVSKIAKYLYPESKILTATGFQKAEFPYNKFDLVIGNPPFGDERLSDKNPNRKHINGLKIHNYVIAKSAMHLRPGQVMAFVVTNRFLDTANKEARDLLADSFDLLAAIRLPNTAFKKNAGTEVTTDIIFLQKRIEGSKPGNTDWLETNGSMVNEDGETVRLNQYFANRPEMMLGKPSMQGTMYAGGARGDQFTLNPREGDKAIGEQIDDLIANHMADLKGVLDKTHNAAMDAQASTISINRVDVAIGGYIMEDGKVLMRDDDDAEGNSVFKRITPTTLLTEKTAYKVKGFNTVKGVLQIRAKAYELINAERADSNNIEQLRKELNELYDSFVENYGHINSNSVAKYFRGDIRIEFGLEKNFKPGITLNKAQEIGFMRDEVKQHLKDLDAYKKAYAEWKSADQDSRGKQPKKPKSPLPGDAAEKSDLLKQRLFYPYKEVLVADNVVDGYAISLSEKGRLDIDYIAQLTGKSTDEVVSELMNQPKPLVFRDPITGNVIQEDEYLSGNVKKKLKEAKRKAGFEANVKALEAVLPADLKQEDIFVDLGQIWVPGEVYSNFLDELGIQGAHVSINEYMGSVAVSGGSSKALTAIGKQFENQDYSVADLFTLVANKKPVVAYDYDADRKKVVNQERTKDLQILVKKMTLLFRDWVFADTARARELVGLYNETQNTTVERQFNGDHLRTVGANPSISLRETQKSAAWRMIQTKSILLDHVVGAGKTMTLITGIMERKRLGLSKKPMLVVPNHLVAQWSKEFYELYPAANILAAKESDFSSKNRKKLLSRIATGKYDAIIVGHSSFKFIAVEKETEMDFMRQEIKHLDDALIAAMENDDKRSVRTIKNRIAKRIEKLDKLNKAPKDDVATFEQMGIDYLAVDESHEFKNLEYASGMRRVSGMGNPAGSERAFDMHMKIRALLDNEEGGAAFATGTPVSNSLVEMYSIMRYLNKEGLRDRRIESFDAWAKNYASVDVVIERTATGKLKERSVMGSFNNVPEMMQLYKQFADVVTMDDLKRRYAEQVKRRNDEEGRNDREDFPIPKIKGESRKLIKAPASEQQIEFMDYLIERTLNVEEDMKSRDFDAKEDNLLWVYNDAKKAALDIRLVDPSAPDFPESKVNKAVKNIFDIYQRWSDDKGTQLVFIDMSTPKKTADKDAKKIIKDALEKADALKGDSAYKTVERLERYEDKWDYLKGKIEERIDDENTNGDTAESLQKFIDEIEQERAVFTTVDTGFSVYEDIKAKLIKKGIPEEEVRFIHDYNTAEKKKELFQLVNSGQVRVLLGSTPKMGAGTNAQERLVALHHIDASMHNRPSDIEQREGRIIRQGNMLFARDPDGFEVELLAYSTENTFDAVSWQTLAKKAKMLESFRSGARSVEEGQGDAASYLEFMAETTGNPIFKEKVQLEREIDELDSEERRLSAQLSAANRVLRNAEDDEKSIRNLIDQAQDSVDKIGNAETFTLDGKTYKNDYDEISNEEKEAYHLERENFLNEMEKYAVAREEWEKAEKGERGKAPKKPKEPERIGYYSARMLAKSEAANFFNALAEKLQSFNKVGDILTLKVGDLNVELEVEKDRHGSLVLSVSAGNLSTQAWWSDNAEARRSMSLDFPRTLTSEVSPWNFRNWLEARKDRLKEHKNDIKVAKEFVENNRFGGAEKLAEKRKRFEYVKQVVDEAENEETKRRSENPNKYIAKDTKRFPDGKPRPKQLKYYFNESPSGVKAGDTVLAPGLWSKEVSRVFSVNNNEKSPLDQWFYELKDEESGDTTSVNAVDYVRVPEGFEFQSIDELEAFYEKEHKKLVAMAKEQAKPSAPKPSKGKETGSTVDNVRSWLPRRVNNLVESGRLRVVQSVKDLPEHLREPGNALSGAVSGSEGLSDIQGLYDDKSDTMYLVADMLNEGNVNPVLSHELFHRGLDKDVRLKEAYDRFTADLEKRFNLASKGIGSEIEKAAYARVVDAGTPAENRIEEFGAYMVSEWQKSPESVSGFISKAIQNFVAAIRAFLVRNGLDANFIKSLTPADLAAMSRYGTKITDTKGGSGIRYSIAPPQQTPAWRRWFGKSKMISGGQPITFYHGTNADFTVFDSQKLTKNTLHSTAELGHFFTRKQAEAAQYGSRVHEVFLRIEKPYVVTSELLDKRMGDDPIQFAAKLKADGFDGLWIKDAGYAVAFDSNQVKLTGNKTPSFADDIRYSKTPTKPANTHTTQSLTDTIRRVMDKAYGAGWFDRLQATGKFKVINRNETDSLLSENTLYAILGDRSAANTQIDTTMGVYSAVARNLLSKIPGIKNVLDYGAGKGRGTASIDRALRNTGKDTIVESYEPFPENWAGALTDAPDYTNADLIKDGSKDAVVNLNVLNVVPKVIRDDIVKNIGRILKPGGVAVISSRRWKGDVDTIKPGNSRPGEEPNSYYVTRKLKGEIQENYQKGIEPDELVNYVLEILPGFDVRKISGYGASAVIIQKPGGTPVLDSILARASAIKVDTGIETAEIRLAAKKLGSGDRDNKFGVGKKMGDELYLHKNYESVLPSSDLTDAKERIGNWQYNVIRYNTKTGAIAFFNSPDFDTAHEPVNGPAMVVEPDGSIRNVPLNKNHDKQAIWHHKWQWVKDDYTGFDVRESIARSIDWQTYANENNVERKRIGYQGIWQNEVVPNLHKSPDILYSKDGEILGFFNPADDTTYFVADNISQNATDSEIKGLMLHEVGVHALNLGRDSKEFQAILKQVEALEKTSEAVKQAAARVPVDTPAHLRSEETLGYLVEQNPNLPVVKRFLTWFRNALRKIGATFKGLERAKWNQWANKLNEADLVYMAQQALRKAPDSLVFDDARDNNEILRLSKEQGYQGSNIGEAEEWLRAKAKGLDMSHKARMERAKAMGFDVDEVYYHGSNLNEKITEITQSIYGVFDGIFVSRNKSSANSHGDVITEFIIKKDKLLDSFEDTDVSYDELLEKLAYYFPDATASQIEEIVYPIVVEESESAYDFDNNEIESITKTDSIGDASWAFQNIRGLLAKSLGYDAVSMNDEHGVSYFIPYESNVRTLDAAFDPDYADSGNLLASFAGQKPETAFDQPLKTQTQLPKGQQTVTVDGVERPALNSEVKPIHTTVEGIENFWRWFGDSKAVDRKGRPLVVYHGTGADFSTFNNKVTDDAFWFAKYKKYANEYAKTRGGKRIISVYLKADNIFDTRNKKEKELFEKWADVDGMFSNDGTGFADGSKFPHWENNSDLIHRVKKLGYDALITSDGFRDGYDNYGVGVFNPDQIKSATGNQGTFDPTNADIRYSKRANDQTIDQTLTGKPRVTKLKKMMRNLKDKARSNIYSVFGVDQMVDMAKHVLPSLSNYQDLMTQRRTLQSNVMLEADRIVRSKWRTLPGDKQEALAKVMHDSTLNDFDPRLAWSDLSETQDGIEVVTQANLDQQAANEVAFALGGSKVGFNRYRFPDYNRAEEFHDRIGELSSIDDAARAKEFSRVQAEYRALPDAAQDIFSEAEAAHEDLYQQKLKALEDRLLMAIADERKRSAYIDMLRLQFESNKLNWYYAPLSRFGDYWFYGTESDGEKVFSTFESVYALNEFRESFLSEGGSEIGSGKKVQDMLGKNLNFEGVGEGFLANLNALLEDRGLMQADPDLQDEIYQMFLSTLPDVSMRKNSIHRKGVKGFEEDAMRSFAQAIWHGAKQLSNLKYNQGMLRELKEAESAIDLANSPSRLAQAKQEVEALDMLIEKWDTLGQAELEARAVLGFDQELYETALIYRKRYDRMDEDSAMSAMRDELAAKQSRIKAAEQLGTNKEDTRFAADILTYLNKSYEDMQNPKFNSWAQFLMTTNFMTMLAFSPSTMIVNVLQTPNVAIPVSYGQFGNLGMKEIAKEYTRTSKQFLEALAKDYRDFDNNHSIYGGLQAQHAEALKTGNTGLAERLSDELTAMKHLLLEGDISRTQAYDLIGVAETGYDYGGVGTRLKEIGGGVMHHSERFNREVTLLTNYRLGRRSGLSHKDAFRKARELNDRSHFNYSPENAPIVMRQPWSKLFFQFKKYQQNMLYVWGKSFADWTYGKTPQEIQQGRRTFLALAASQTIFAGTLGFPAAGMLLALANMVGGLGSGDDDEPFDAEREIRLGLIDLFEPIMGKEAAKTASYSMTHGLFTGLTPVNISSRLSLRDTLFRDPPRELEGRDAGMHLVASLAGPTAGTIMNLYQGMDYAQDGEWMRGAEAVLPKVLRDLLKAARFGTEDAKTLRGNLIKEMKASEVAWQALGFSSSDLSKKYDEKKFIMRANNALSEARSKLIAKVAEAQLTGNSDSYQKSMNKIRDWNRKHKEWPIKPDNIKQSIRSRQRIEKNMGNTGIYLNPKLDYLRDKFSL